MVCLLWGLTGPFEVWPLAPVGLSPAFALPRKLAAHYVLGDAQRMALRSIRAFGRTWDLVVERRGAKVRVSVEQAGKRGYNRTVAPGTTVEIVLP